MPAGKRRTPSATWRGPPAALNAACACTDGSLRAKFHRAVEQGHKPLSVVVTAGLRGDSPWFTVVLDEIRVPRPGGGRRGTR